MQAAISMLTEGQTLFDPPVTSAQDTETAAFLSLFSGPLSPPTLLYPEELSDSEDQTLPMASMQDREKDASLSLFTCTPVSPLSLLYPDELSDLEERALTPTSDSEPQDFFDWRQFVNPEAFVES